MMVAAEWQRAAALYLPLVAAFAAKLLNGRQPRQFAACLLSLLWTVPSLLALQLLNEQAHWWSFAAGSAASFRGMPLELFLGWTILWGLVPALAFPRSGTTVRVVVMVAVDCVLMPCCRGAVQLHASWLVGEAAGVVMVLMPALCLARWTQKDTHLASRVALQTFTSGMLFLFLIPEVIFALRPGAGWAPLFGEAPWIRQIELQATFLLAIPGLGAVLEFLERGHGTPIPFDPPQTLVTSGIYRYCANPMQMSCGIVMFAWAGLLKNGWMALAACVSFFYSAGIAEWDEQQDLALRFGQQWKDYRKAVRSWSLRWSPHCSGPPALIYIARECGPCSEVRAWIESRHPKGLQVVDAETLPVASIRRTRYDPADGNPAVDGVRAMGRVLEHLHLGWAICGTFLRLPGVWQVVQLFMDASGLGPREIRSVELQGASRWIGYNLPCGINSNGQPSRSKRECLPRTTAGKDGKRWPASLF